MVAVNTWEVILSSLLNSKKWIGFLKQHVWKHCFTFPVKTDQQIMQCSFFFNCICMRVWDDVYSRISLMCLLCKERGWHMPISPPFLSLCKRGSFSCGSSDWRLLLLQLGEKLGQGRCHADINNSVGMVRACWGGQTWLDQSIMSPTLTGVAHAWWSWTHQK